MATETIGWSISKGYGEQVSLTTTAAHLLYRIGFKEIILYCPSAWRLGIAPKLASVQYFDGTNYTDYTTFAVDRDDSTHVPLDGMTTSHFLYLGFRDKVRGFYFNIDGSNKNAVVTTLDMEYCSAISDGAGTFTDVGSDNDDTKTGGNTPLAQDGLYSFTLPAVVQGYITTLGGGQLYWYRFKPLATLSATIDLIDIIPACEDTNYLYMEAGVNYQFALNLTKNGAFEFDHAGSDTLNVGWLAH